MTIIIYFDETKKNKQVIHPTNKFDGQVTKLEETLMDDIFEATLEAVGIAAI